MKKKYKTIVIDASRNRSGGAIVYLKNFLKHLNLDKTNIKQIFIFSHKNILNQIPNKKFLKKISHPFLEKNILFQIIWQLFFLPLFLKKNKIDIFYSTDAATFCNHSNSIIMNQDILSFDNDVLNFIPFSIEKIRLYIIKFLQVRSMNNAKEIIFLSKKAKNIISKYLKNKNLNIIPHGVDEKILRLSKNNLIQNNWDSRSKKKIKIVYTSPLYLYKNHQSVIKAYSHLKKKYNNIDIKFIGSYEHDLDLFQKLIKDNPIINKSHFTGSLKQEDVIETLINSDIFIFASSSETFGISLLEAMAVGLPIICSNRSCLPEILQNGGLYFNPRNYLGLSRQIDFLIRNKKLRKKISEHAKKRALKFSWKNNAHKFCKLMDKLS
jgi:glycosyltransferase involved in cell wall biosynthesis